MEKTISEIAELWSRILIRIKKEIGEDNREVFDSFFKDTYIAKVEDNKFVVVANTVVAAEVLNTTLKEKVNEVVRSATESNFEVVFVAQSEVEEKTIEEKASFFSSSKLNPSYTFKNFVVGQSNREAYQASLMISKNPGELYNPLLIYSDSGLGKTHLLHAIGNAIRESSPSKRVLYVTTQDFF